jgi:hypothetical protein
MQQRKKRRGILGTLLLTAILVTAAFAYASGVTVPNNGGNIGYGNANVSTGYAVSGIDYTTSADYKNVTAMTFTINPVPAEPTADLRVSFDGGSRWYTCTLATPAVCDTSAAPALTVASVQTLDVFAKG